MVSSVGVERRFADLTTNLPQIYGFHTRTGDVHRRAASRKQAADGRRGHAELERRVARQASSSCLAGCGVAVAATLISSHQRSDGEIVTASVPPSLVEVAFVAIAEVEAVSSQLVNHLLSIEVQRPVVALSVFEISQALACERA